MGQAEEARKFCLVLHVVGRGGSTSGFWEEDTWADRKKVRKCWAFEKTLFCSLSSHSPYKNRSRGESAYGRIPQSGSVCSLHVCPHVYVCACVCVFVYATMEDVYMDSVTLSKPLEPL